MEAGNDLVLQIKLLHSSCGVAGNIDGSVITRESRSFENTCYEFPLGFVHEVARVRGIGLKLVACPGVSCQTHPICLIPEQGFHPFLRVPVMLPQ